MDLDNQGYDPDYDPMYSRSKKGGYTWAGGHIDPSVPLSGGYKEHPTMSLSESIKRQQNFQQRAKSDAIFARALYEVEGSAF